MSIVIKAIPIREIIDVDTPAMFVMCLNVIFTPKKLNIVETVYATADLTTVSRCIKSHLQVSNLHSAMLPNIAVNVTVVSMSEVPIRSHTNALQIVVSTVGRVWLPMACTNVLFSRLR